MLYFCWCCFVAVVDYDYFPYKLPTLHKRSTNQAFSLKKHQDYFSVIRWEMCKGKAPGLTAFTNISPASKEYVKNFCGTSPLRTLCTITLIFISSRCLNIQKLPQARFTRDKHGLPSTANEDQRSPPRNPSAPRSARSALPQPGSLLFVL